MPETELLREILGCSHAARALARSGVTTLPQLRALSREELLAIRGVGPVTAEYLERVRQGGEAAREDTTGGGRGMGILWEARRDRLTVQVYGTRAEMGRAAAAAAAERLRALLSQREQVNALFAAAPSQNETLEALTQEQGIDWERVNAFHMDEYCGLPAGAEQTFGAYLREHIFGRVPFRSVSYLRGDAEDSDAECARYAALLTEFPPDIVLLGIGENGHVAFNDPGVADFADPRLVRKVPLDEVCRAQQVHDGCFPAIEAVPTHALTLTVPALMHAGCLVCTVPSAAKAAAVAATLDGPVGPAVPATAMRQHPDARLFCDAAAASLAQRPAGDTM